MTSTDEQQMAADDRCWDGNWMTDGLDGMMIELSDEHFCSTETEEFCNDKEQEAAVGGVLQEEHEFILFPSEGDEEGFSQLHQRILRPRQLHLADGVIRRFSEGCCPPRIRIRKLASHEMEQLLEHKKLGNQAFSKKEFEKAIGHYDDALLFVQRLFVAPEEQIKEIVNVLSNQAECQLKLKRYEDAGSTATTALLFYNNHEKSRLRRAKAELAIAGLARLIQAQVDLQEIVEEKFSKTGVKQATELLEQLEEILKMERKTEEKKNPDFDYDFFVRSFKAKCW